MTDQADKSGADKSGAEKPSPRLSSPVRDCPELNGRALLLSMVFLTCLFAGIVWVKESLRVVINETRSLPHRVFLVLNDTVPERGDYVLFDPPERVGAPLPFIKQVSGVPGDVIRHEHGNVLINDTVIGFVKPVSLEGKPLFPTPAGVIPPHHYFVTSPHQDSYDSRYKNMGLVPQSRLLGRALALF